MQFDTVAVAKSSSALESIFHEITIKLTIVVHSLVNALEIL